MLIINIVCLYILKNNDKIFMCKNYSIKENLSKSKRISKHDRRFDLSMYMFAIKMVKRLTKLIKINDHAG